MLGAEEMEVKTKEWLRGAIRRIRKEEPVYVKKDLIIFTHFFWKIGHKPSEEDIEPITYFLNQLNFNSEEKKKKNRHNFRHVRKNRHIEVIEERDGFRISAHIDVVPHFEIRRSKYTTRLLFELSRFLQWQYPQSKVIRVGELEEPRLPKEIRNEISRNTDQLKVESKQLEGVKEPQSTEKPVLDSLQPTPESIFNETKMKKSQESILNLISDYRETLKQEKEVERLCEAKREENRKQFQENREIIKRKEEEWGDLFQDIMSEELINEFRDALNTNRFELDDKKVGHRIRERFHEILINLDSDDKGFFILDFNSFFNNNFQDQFSIVQNYTSDLLNTIHQEHTEQERKIDEYIYGFLRKMTRKLMDCAISYKVHSVVRYSIIQLIEYYFKEELRKKEFSYKDWYLERFSIIFPSESAEIIKKIENRLKENAPLEKRRLTKSIKTILQQVFSFILGGIILIFFIGLIGFFAVSFLNILPTREDMAIGLIVVLVIIVIAILLFLSIVPRE